MTVNPDIIGIIAAGRIEGNTYYLPPRQLDRKTYDEVNRCLSNLGGQWVRKAKGHVFDYDPEDAVNNLIITGETDSPKKTFQFFPTPKEIAEKMCDMAELSTSSIVLEPSCGRGDLADVIYSRDVKAVRGVELNKEMSRYLTGKPYTALIGIDFLDFSCDVKDGRIEPVWDRIIMNPPFSKQQDIAHIHAAWITLKEGVLVSVVSPSPFYRDNEKSVKFREFLADNHAEVVDVPAGMFKDSGTTIATKIIKIRKAG